MERVREENYQLQNDEEKKKMPLDGFTLIQVYTFDWRIRIQLNALTKIREWRTADEEVSTWHKLRWCCDDAIQCCKKVT